MTNTPLDSIIEKLGFGKYQKKLLILCGFGWLCDNMWLQSIAIILPRVQIHFRTPDRQIGFLFTSVFFGMMIGAWVWGISSDLYGRRTPFNVTLLISSIFGILSGLAPSFSLLCLFLFGLGFAVGGSMPTDGTLFLENIPKSRHYLLTALSVFFSFGSVISSSLGLLILPHASCREPEAGKTLLCNSELQNRGWRYLLISLAMLTFIMFICRVTLFTLKESPKYLMSVGRTTDAVLAVKLISAQNGSELIISEADVEDNAPEVVTTLQPQYHALGDHSINSLSSVYSLVGIIANWRDLSFNQVKNLQERIEMLLVPDLRLTTILVWGIWMMVSFAYTSFNVFLPTYLEKLHQGSDQLEDSLKDYLLYTISGCPGSLIAAWMIETKLGRKQTMVISTLATSISILGFLKVRTSIGVRISSMLVSLTTTILYAVIYGYTPEVFPSSIRGTGYGIASSLSRISGMISPLIVGQLIRIWGIQSALWLSVIIFFFVTGLISQLPLETRVDRSGL
ncbi:hypothetical protein O181_060779 [Austropuccinia psidii MF-1]|uniref:Major facilitator superfamily (MFS) profile domain-containing protein n=1 Tax=Austropuccinia psidii MF-1 TaxID=1389203 RepID=A0A9Q3HZY5_9BASI|nr:hypothetical protein [Austropuccinia psidii MF-1]